MLDTQTGLMWTRRIDGSPLRSLYDLGEVVKEPVPGHGTTLFDRFKLRPSATHTALPGLPFDNWAIPTGEDLHKLLSHRSGNGVEWLANHAHISRVLLDAANSHVWISDGFEDFGNQIKYRLYSLRDAVIAAPTYFSWASYAFPRTWQEAFSSQVQGILYERRLVGDQAYWWR